MVQLIFKWFPQTEAQSVDFFQVSLMMFSSCEDRFDKSWFFHPNVPWRHGVFKTVNTQIDWAGIEPDLFRSGAASRWPDKHFSISRFKIDTFRVIHVRHLLLAAEENGIWRLTSGCHPPTILLRKPWRQEERDVRINKRFSLFEDVRKLCLSCVPP